MLNPLQLEFFCDYKKNVYNVKSININKYPDINLNKFTIFNFLIIFISFNFFYSYLYFIFLFYYLLICDFQVTWGYRGLKC